MITIPPINWAVARRVARPAAGPLPETTRREAHRLVASLRLAARRAGELVVDASAMPGRPAGRVVVCDRATWARGAGAMADAMLTHLSLGEPAPGPLQSIKGAGHGILAGLALGLVGRQLLGQYDPATRQLFLLAPNILHLQRVRGFDPKDFQLWVATHEQSHAVQFSAAPWLEGHITERLRVVATDEVSALQMAQNLAGGGGLASMMTSPTAQHALDELSATMTLLEGHADFVADTVGASHIPTVRKLRAAFARTGRSSALARVLPLTDKGAQYRDGLRFCRKVAARTGAAGLAAAFDAPENLPRPAEIRDPQTWIRRVHGTA